MSHVGSGNGDSTEIELNLASIIDCFTVLITYLLVSASFITLGTLEVTVPAEAASSAQSAPSLSLKIEVRKRGGLKLVVEGAQSQSVPITGRELLPDYTALDEQLGGIKAAHAEIHTALLMVDDSIHHKELVHVVEVVKKFFPDVSLAGLDSAGGS